MSLLHSFIRHSQQIGRRLDLVQGAGGNTSVKLAKNRMAIKSSGRRLADMQPDRGYVVLDTEHLEQYLDEASLQPDPVSAENLLHHRLKQVVPHDSSERPSMEAAMHLYFPTHVVHTHSVYANVFTCMKDGDAVLSSLFGPDKPQYVEYVTPGQALAQRIRSLPKRADRSSVIFLMNHGVITAAGQAARAYQTMQKINAGCRKYIKSRLGQWPDFTTGGLKPLQIGPHTFFQSSHPLTRSYIDGFSSTEQVVKQNCFPDSIVFCSRKLLVTTQNRLLGDFETFRLRHDYYPTITIIKGQTILYLGNPDLVEPTQTIFEAVLYIQLTIRALKAKLNPLTKANQDTLLSLDSEKYRQNVNV